MKPLFYYRIKWGGIKANEYSATADTLTIALTYVRVLAIDYPTVIIKKCKRKIL